MSELTELKNKILCGKKLSIFEVQDLVYSGNIPIIEEEIYEEHRDFITYRLILSINKRFFSIYYNKTKSELDEYDFYEQISEEVEPKEVLVTKWRKKE